ncbi:MAG TPA: HD domain-containing phosphohydrolase [Syntrophomonadaceae bacterium]|nr:HD domain-containing phosphohydrolase [Syntrophomonadaceae bacterium]
MQLMNWFYDFLSMFIIVSCMLLILFLVLKLNGRGDTIENKAEFGSLVGLAFSLALWALANLTEAGLTGPWMHQWFALNLVAFFLSFYIMVLGHRLKPQSSFRPILYVCMVFILANMSGLAFWGLNNIWWRLASFMGLGLLFLAESVLIFLAGRKANSVFYSLVSFSLAAFIVLYVLYNMGLISDGSPLRHLYLLMALFIVVALFYYSMDQAYFYTTRDLSARIDLLQEEYAAEMETVENVVISLARTLDAKDRYTEGHTERVSQYSIFLGERLGFSDKRLETLRIGALIHDIGKIGIDQNILNKPGKLTDEERHHIEMHPSLGQQICSPLKALHEVEEIIRGHHEKLDGSGYPDGLKGEEISLETRIVTIADIFDALTTERSYRKALPVDRAMEIMKLEAAQGKLDAQLFHEFQAMLYENAFLG